VRHMHAAMGRGRVDPDPLAPINTVSKGEERGKERKKKRDRGGTEEEKKQKERQRESGEKDRD